MAKQKLSPKAAAAKKKRDLAFAKTFARKRKKAENQRKRRAAKKAGKDIRGKDYDHKKKKQRKKAYTKGKKEPSKLETYKYIKTLPSTDTTPVR